MPVEPREVALRRRHRLRRAHRSARWPSRRTSTFKTDVDVDAAARTIHTDPQRLQQVLKNLLANAFKFTERGSVDAARAPARAGHALRERGAARQGGVIAFSVVDTGIGIPQRQAAADLRGVPAGGRHHQPQVRRHRPGPVDQPRDRAPAGRRDPRRERRRARAAPSRSTCPSATSRRRRRRGGGACVATTGRRAPPSFASVVGTPTALRRARSDRHAADRRRSRPTSARATACCWSSRTT